MKAFGLDFPDHIKPPRMRYKVVCHLCKWTGQTFPSMMMPAMQLLGHAVSVSHQHKYRTAVRNDEELPWPTMEYLCRDANGQDEWVHYQPGGE